MQRSQEGECDSESAHRRRGMNCGEVEYQEALGDDEWGFIPRTSLVQQELQAVVLRTIGQSEWLLLSP